MEWWYSLPEKDYYYETTNDYRGKIKRFSNQDLALYLLIISSFLPFYLFLALLKHISYFLPLLEINTSSKDLVSHPFLLTFIGFSFAVSMVSMETLWAVISIGFLMYTYIFNYYPRRLTPDFFHHCSG